MCRQFVSAPRHQARKGAPDSLLLMGQKGGSSSPIERLLAKEEIAGSNPVLRSSRSGGIGRRGSLKNCWGATPVSVRPRPSAPQQRLRSKTHQQAHLARPTRDSPHRPAPHHPNSTASPTTAKARPQPAHLPSHHPVFPRPSRTPEAGSL